MTPAATAPPWARAEAGCDVTVTANASAATALTEMIFNIFYPFKVGC